MSYFNFFFGKPAEAIPWKALWLCFFGSRIFRINKLHCWLVPPLKSKVGLEMLKHFNGAMWFGNLVINMEPTEGRSCYRRNAAVNTSVDLQLWWESCIPTSEPPAPCRRLPLPCPFAVGHPTYDCDCENFQERKNEVGGGEGWSRGRSNQPHAKQVASPASKDCRIFPRE